MEIEAQRRVKLLVQGHIAVQWQSQDSDPGIWPVCAIKLPLIPVHLCVSVHVDFVNFVLFLFM